MRTAHQSRVRVQFQMLLCLLFGNGVRCGRREMWKKYCAAVGILCRQWQHRRAVMLGAPVEGGISIHPVWVSISICETSIRLGLTSWGVLVIAVCRSRPHRLSYPRKRTRTISLFVACVFCFSWFILELSVSFTCRYSTLHSMLFVRLSFMRGISLSTVCLIISALPDTRVESRKGADSATLSLGIRNYGTWISCLSVKKFAIIFLLHHLRCFVASMRPFMNKRG